MAYTQAGGWTAYTDDPTALRNGFANSLLTLAAYEEASLAGLIRVVGDGYTVVLVQDTAIEIAVCRILLFVTLDYLPF